ncbi:MAG: GatB/YqeY domain-containing protein [Saprospirales bacterium]|nr:GatB/YqeY domain-containing protein [Saprospirales bacterium]MBK8489956.1 GatB/YqeY domain-containing protein [Saprospirales bacterium]
MNFEAQINEDLKVAMKAQDKQALRGIRAIKQAILLAKTDGSHEEITEEKAIKMIQKLVKQRKDSLSIYETQGREDLAQVEREELEILERYLPKAMSQEELEAAVKRIIDQVGATSMKDMGKVMGLASKEFAGSADGSAISAVVKKLLG